MRARPLLVLIPYAVLLAFTISRHEPWFDEAQAWLLARDLGPLDLFLRYLRYEGHPGLWYSLLMIPAKLNAPYVTLSIISGLIAFLGVLVFVLYSPFPAWIKLLFPFSYFIVYQYAVVARSYVLLPILLFAAAVLARDLRRRMTLWILVLCLIANVSVDGVLISAGILCGYSIWRYWKVYAAYAAAVAWIAFEVWPKSDATFAVGYTTTFRDMTLQSLAMWNGSMTGVWPLTLIVVAISCWWFAKTGTLLPYLGATALLLCLSAVKYTKVWHEGAFFLTWVFAMWTSFDRQPARMSAVIAGAWIAVLGAHLYWSSSAIACDIEHNYSGSRELATYIKQEHLESRRIYAFGFHSMSILPYFPQNIFDNYNHKKNPSFWWWSGRNTMDDTLADVPRDRPDVIIFGIKTREQEQKAEELRSYLPNLGYRLVRRFDGQICWKAGTVAKDAKDAFDLYLAAPSDARPAP